MYQNNINYIISKCSNRIEGNLLDLGCGKTFMLIELCDKLNIDGTILGVEDDRDKRIEKYFGKDIHEFAREYEKIIKNSFDIEYKDSDLSKIRIIPKSIEKFLEIYQENSLKFKLVLLSNVLHFYPVEARRLEIYNYIYNILEESGFVYVQVASENHYSYKERSDTIVFSLSNIIDEIQNTKFTLVDTPALINKSGNWQFILKK